MNKKHPILIARAPQLRLGLGLRLAAALRAGGALGAVAIVPLVLGSTTRAQAQDTTAPQITLASPVNNSYGHVLPTFSGTATDSGPGATGVRNVTVGVFSDTLKRWWNPSTSSFSSTSIVELTAALNGTAWTYSGAPANIPLPDGLYVVVAFATDNGGNRDPNGVQSLAYIDNAAPNPITFEQPAPNTQVTSLGSVNGRAFDNTGGSGVASVQVTIQRPDGLYWNGSAYQTTAFRLATSLAGSFWSLQNGPATAADLPDGNYTLKAFAIDKLGNEGSATQTTSVMQPPPPVPPDTTAPTITLATPVDNTFAKSIAAPSGTVADTGSSGLKQVVVGFFSDALKKWWDGAAFSSDTIVELPTTINNGSWSYTGSVPSGPDGLIVVQAYADDKAGNRSRAQANVTLDNTAPTQITFEQPTPGTSTTSLTNISGRAFDNTGGSGVASVQVTIQRPDGLYWNGSAYQAARVRLDTSFAGGFWSLQTTLRAGSDLPPGNYTLTAFARDVLGNEDSASQTTAVTQPVQPPPPDTVAPQITLATPVNNSIARSLDAPTGTASDTGGSGLRDVKVAFFRTSDQKWWNGTAFASDTIVELGASVSNGTWAYNGPRPAGDQLTDGLYVTLAFADDGAGNRSRAQSVVTIDNTKPVSLSFQKPSPNSTVTDLTDINGFAADNVGGVGLASVQVVIRNSAGLYWNGTAFVAGEQRLDTALGGGFWSLATSLRAGSNLPDGSYALTAYAVDLLGNAISTSEAVTVKAPAPPSTNPGDITPPHISLGAPVSNSFSRTFVQPRGSVSDEDGGSGLRDVKVAFFRDINGTGGLWWDGTAFASPTPVELSATVNGTSWSYDGPLPSGAGLPDGLYVVLAFADDNNGNRNRAQAVLNIDTVAPVKLTFSSPAAGVLVSNLANINGRVEDNAGGSDIAGVQVSIRNPAGQYWNGSTYQPNPIRLKAEVGGTFWSLKTRLLPGAALPNGVYTLTAYAQDGAGNERAVTQATRVIGDIVPPVVRWITPRAGQVLAAFPTLSGSVQDAGGAGVDHVEIELLRLKRTPREANVWWNGRIYQSTPVRLRARLTGSTWTLASPLPSGPYLLNANYVAIAYGVDRVNNVGSRDVAFSIDRVAPLPPAFGNPRPNSTVTTLAPLLVTVGDRPGPGAAGSGVVKAEFVIRRERDGLYWNGTAFTSAPVYLPAFQVSATRFRRDGVPGGINLTPGFYTIQARVTDRAGNTAVSSERVRVRDAVAPQVAIFTPVGGQLRRDFGVIVGSASDNAGGSGLAEVRVAIRRLSDGAYWNGTAFTSTVASVAATISGTNWSLRNVPPPSLIVAGSYEITAVAIDRDGNQARARVVAPINPDSTPPTVKITDPHPSTLFRSIERVSGTVADNPGGIGVDRVVVGILRGSDQKWWNGHAFTDTFTPLRATLSGSTWSLTSNLPPASQTPRGSYTIVAQAFDKLGNFNDKISQDAVSVTLDPNAPRQGEAPSNSDRTPPTLTVTDPISDSTYNRLVRITGTASDNAGGVGLDRVVVGILRQRDNLWWNGHAFAPNFTPLPATLSGSTWSLTSDLPPADQTPTGLYTIVAQAFDRAGNFNNRTSQQSVTVALDPHGPSQDSAPSIPAA